MIFWLQIGRWLKPNVAHADFRWSVDWENQGLIQCHPAVEVMYWRLTRDWSVCREWNANNGRPGDV